MLRIGSVKERGGGNAYLEQKALKRNSEDLAANLQRKERYSVNVHRGAPTLATPATTPNSCAGYRADARCIALIYTHPAFWSTNPHAIASRPRRSRWDSLAGQGGLVKALVMEWSTRDFTSLSSASPSHFDVVKLFQ